MEPAGRVTLVAPGAATCTCRRRMQLVGADPGRVPVELVEPVWIQTGPGSGRRNGSRAPCGAVVRTAHGWTWTYWPPCAAANRSAIGSGAPADLDTYGSWSIRPVCSSCRCLVRTAAANNARRACQCAVDEMAHADASVCTRAAMCMSEWSAPCRRPGVRSRPHNLL